MKRPLSKMMIGVMYAIVLVPMIPLILWSFAFKWKYPDMLPEWSTRAWDYVFSQNAMVEAIINSILISAIVTVLCFFIAFTAAKAIGTRKFRFKRALEVTLLLPALIPTLTIAMGMQKMFVLTPLYSSFFGMIIGQLIFALPYTIFCLSDVFKNYDPDYEAQAVALGADSFDVFFHITLPAIAPGAVVAAMFTYLTAWSQYLILIMVGDPAVRTLPVLLFNMIGGSDTAIAAALSIVFIVPVLILLIFSSILFSNSGVSSGGIDKL